MASLKERWGVTSNFQIVIIFIVFAITGSTSAWITKPILEFLGITKQDFHIVPYWILRIVLILPVYKVILIIIGTIFGQHTFFWNFVKKMLFRMKLGFLYGKQKNK
ncbi:DUF6787 family protein [Flavobacterium sp. I3-2]|uniref:DUF6787 family protein n=1 Tax=Flavobacterium sp. I3-2 TaxID=2748319 RepID=UPI0015AA8FDB|nr:DUF6787 family protein [Flavobacterium sp. I3-2]